MDASVTSSRTASLTCCTYPPGGSVSTTFSKHASSYQNKFRTTQRRVAGVPWMNSSDSDQPCSSGSLSDFRSSNKQILATSAICERYTIARPPRSVHLTTSPMQVRVLSGRFRRQHIAIAKSCWFTDGAANSVFQAGWRLTSSLGFVAKHKAQRCYHAGDRDEYYHG